MCGPVGYLFVLTSFLGIFSITWFVPIVSLAVAIIFSVIYNWPIPQEFAAADTTGGNVVAVGEQDGHGC
jgi:hypothetical protein